MDVRQFILEMVAAGVIPRNVSGRLVRVKFLGQTFDVNPVTGAYTLLPG